MPVEELKQELDAMDFKAFLDEPEHFFHVQGKVLQINQKVMDGATSVAAAEAALKTPIMLPRLSSEFGLFAGECFRQWIEEKIVRKTGISHLTFGELSELQKTDSRLKALYLIGSNLTLGIAETFSTEDPKMRDVVISDAVRISISIPYIFVPHPIHRKIEGERQPDFQGYCYVDGGLFENYPVRLFDHTRYCLKTIGGPDCPCFNQETLGFRLYSNPNSLSDRDIPIRAEDKIQGLFGFTGAVLAGLKNVQQSDHLRSPDTTRTVYIDTLDVSTLNFDITDKQKTDLKRSGYQATMTYFSPADDVAITAGIERFGVLGSATGAAASATPRRDREAFPATKVIDTGKCVVS